MRSLFFLLAFFAITQAYAQTVMPMAGTGILQQDAFHPAHFVNDSNVLQQKWFVNGYAGIGAGVGFGNTSNMGFFPAQFGLQLNRRLTNNLFAFAGVQAAPAFFNLNRSFSTAEFQKNYMAVPGFRANGFGMYTGLQAGLMYVNDQRTFSISGSINVSQGDAGYPAPRVEPQKQPAFTGSRR